MCTVKSLVTVSVSAKQSCCMSIKLHNSEDFWNAREMIWFASMPPTKPASIAFPCFFLVVKTNVDYQVSQRAILQSKQWSVVLKHFKETLDTKINYKKYLFGCEKFCIFDRLHIGFFLAFHRLRYLRMFILYLFFIYYCLWSALQLDARLIMPEPADFVFCDPQNVWVVSMQKHLKMNNLIHPNMHCLDSK